MKASLPHWGRASILIWNKYATNSGLTRVVWEDRAIDDRTFDP